MEYNQQSKVNTVKIEYTTVNGETVPLYVGDAAPKSAVSAPRWRIRKLTYDASANVTDVQWAHNTNGTGGSAEFKCIWNDRASLSYS